MRALSARASSSHSIGGSLRSGPRGRLVRARGIVAMAASSSHSKADAARLERAKSYPYARPSSSFVYINGHAFLFDCAAWPEAASGSWLTDLPVRPPAELLLSPSSASSSPSSPDAWPDAPLSVADACARLGFCARRALELDPRDDDAAAQATPAGHFVPILAVGSNAGVSQLARKFPPELFPRGVVVPVVRALLIDFDVCYAPLVTSYGAAPATLHPSPGTRVELYVTHLSPALARRMHETEGAYNLQRIGGVALREGAGLGEGGFGVGGGGGGGGGGSAEAMPSETLEATATTILTYGHQAGTLQVSFAGGRRRLRRGAGDGGAAEKEEEDKEEAKDRHQTPVALAEIRARGRRYPALTQRQMLRALRHALHAAEAEDGEGGLAGGSSSSSSESGESGSEADDAAPLNPRPLPPIPHPEDDPAPAWLGLSEPELDAFLLRCLDCPDTRRRRVQRLAAAARPIGGELGRHLSLEVLATMGTVLSDNVK